MLTTSVERLEGVTVKLTVTVPAAVKAAAVEQVLARLPAVLSAAVAPEISNLNPEGPLS